MLGRLKKRWNISSNIQLILILAGFAITGTLTIQIRELIFQIFSFGSGTYFLLKILIYLLLVLAVYPVVLLIVGALLGQFNFFRNFIMNILMRIKKNV